MKKAKPKQKPKRSPRIENSIIKQWTAPKKLALITDWAKNGYGDHEIAEKMGISVPTFRRYRLEAPAIDEAVRDGKEVIDHKVESALLKAALGYQTKEVKIIITTVKPVKEVKGKEGKDCDLEEIGTKKVRILQETTTREVPPNVLACQTWLFNRQRDKWKRNWDNEIAVEDDKNINITITRAGKTIELGEE